MMTSPAPQNQAELCSLPSELILNVFYSLPEFPDVLHLAGACKRFRQIFHDNVSSVYRRVNPAVLFPRGDLVFHPYSGAPSEISTVQEFLQWTREAIRSDKLIQRFKRNCVPKCAGQIPE